MIRLMTSVLKVSATAALVIFTWGSQLCAQESGSATLPSLDEGSIFIWNATSKKVIFYLSSDKSNYKRFELNPDSTGKPDFGNKTESIYFRVKTGATVVDRTLTAQRRYRILLVADKGFLDIQEIKR